MLWYPMNPNDPLDQLLEITTVFVAGILVYTGQ
jgi:hypothetical protein